MIKIFNHFGELQAQSILFQETDNGYIVEDTWYQATAGFEFEIIEENEV